MAQSFEFYELPNNNVNGASIPISNAPIPLASLTLDVTPGGMIALRSNVGWQTILGGRTNVLFKLWRGAPITGTLICSAVEGAESSFDRDRVTSFLHVDSGFTTSQRITYTLTVETPDAGKTVDVIGPVTFIARLIP